MPTEKELSRIQNSQATLKEILKVHLKEPFTEKDLRFIETHLQRLEKHNCYVTYEKKIIEEMNKTKNTEPLIDAMSEGYLIFELPQLSLKLLYVKVFGGKGFFGKKIHYSIYLQEFDEKTWTPISTQKSLTIAITSMGNLFRQQGLLKGSAI